MKTLDDIQLYVAGIAMTIFLLGLQQDIFTLVEGIAGFWVALLVFIDAGIQLIIAD